MLAIGFSASLAAFEFGISVLMARRLFGRMSSFSSSSNTQHFPRQTRLVCQLTGPKWAPFIFARFGGLNDSSSAEMVIHLSLSLEFLTAICRFQFGERSQTLQVGWLIWPMTHCHWIARAGIVLQANPASLTSAAPRLHRSARRNFTPQLMTLFLISTNRYKMLSLTI